MQPLVAYATHSVQPKIVDKPLGRSVHYCSILAEKNNRSVLFPHCVFDERALQRNAEKTPRITNLVTFVYGLTQQEHSELASRLLSLKALP